MANAKRKVKVCKPAFLPFEKALLYARSLKLKNTKAWEAWRMTGARPANIPSAPHTVYKHEGWQGWGHWLGTGNVAPKHQQFLPFEKALLYARSLKLKNMREWQAWCKSGGRHVNMPSTPHQVYKHDGWQGWGHWLGTGNVGVKKDQQFLPFNKALLHARSLNLKSEKEWRAWCKSGTRPSTMPSNPDATYKHDGWQGYGHWLGTGAVADKDKQFLPFKTALLHARSLKLKGKKEWDAWRMTAVRPDNVPCHPDRTYKHDGWQGWGHWLGTGNVAAKEQQFLPFKKALLHARCLKLKCKAEWVAWCKIGKRPANVPAGPHEVYKHDGWQGYGHWLGTGNVGVKKDQKFLPFKKALRLARSLKLKDVKEWEAWRKSGARPANVPSRPDVTYKQDGWQGYWHWLGTGTVAPKEQKFLPFKKALLYARSRKLKSNKEWREWSTSSARPANTPSFPEQVYKHDGWQGYGHWLGTS